jgi:hypothetical protein
MQGEKNLFSLINLVSSDCSDVGKMKLLLERLSFCFLSVNNKFCGCLCGMECHLCHLAVFRKINPPVGICRFLHLFSDNLSRRPYRRER